MSTALEMSEATKNIGGLDVSYRPGTADEQVLDLVLAHNRYGFPDDMTGMTVVDIGAHIGSATMLCASRGATVYAYEPCHDNYVLCRRNIRGLSAFVRQQAVGAPGTRVFYLNPANTASNGGRALVVGNNGTTYEVVVGEVHAGQWPNPTPELDKQINDAADSLDTHYTRTRISGCEYRWDHR